MWETLLIFVMAFALFLFCEVIGRTLLRILTLKRISLNTEEGLDGFIAALAGGVFLFLIVWGIVFICRRLLSGL
jgi:hypothetical protein